MKEGNRFMLSWGETPHFMLSRLSTSGRSMLIFYGFGGAAGFSKKNDKEIPAKRFGFYSSTGDVFCNMFYWGENKFRSPFDTSKILLSQKYMNIGDSDSDSPMPIKVEENTQYCLKNGMVQDIDNIEFYLLERRWTSDFAKFFRLQNFIFRRKINLVFYTPNGLGTQYNTSGLIQVGQDLIDTYDNYTLSSNEEKLKQLKELIDERISYFMIMDRNF